VLSLTDSALFVDIMNPRLCLVILLTNSVTIAVSGSCTEHGVCAEKGTTGLLLLQKQQAVTREMIEENQEEGDVELELPDATGIAVGSPPLMSWQGDGLAEPPRFTVEPELPGSLLQAEHTGARPANALDKKAFLAMHNLYRCMHGVPKVTWSDAMATNAHNYIEGMTKMKHSASYSIPAPAGPAGENLAMGSGNLGAADSVSMWYSEVNDCQGGPKGFTDGCASGVGGKATGHFTALIWKGVKEIGCAFSDSVSPTLVVCRYRAGDSLSMDTPNMNKPSNYPNQVFKQTHSETECEGGDDGKQPVPETKPAPAPAPVAPKGGKGRGEKGGSGAGGGGGEQAAPCKPSCAKSKKDWTKKCKKQNKCGGCAECSSDLKPEPGGDDPVAATPAPTNAVTAAPAPGKCLVSDPNWQCKGYQCVEHSKYKWYSAAGGAWCLTAASSYCQKQDSSWCQGGCACPGSCPHACGRCPPQ